VDHPLRDGHAEDMETEEVGHAEEIESKHIRINGSPGGTAGEIPRRIEEPSPIVATKIVDTENAKNEYTQPQMKSRHDHLFSLKLQNSLPIKEELLDCARSYVLESRHFPS
jgi:hypothetical protein